MPPDLLAHGERKFPNAGVLLSSAGRGWRGVAAEVRAHPAGNLPALVPTQMELTLALNGNSNARVSRKGNGCRQDTFVRDGTLWLCPVGVGEDDTHISGHLPEILHIYLAPHRFTELACLYGDYRVRADAVRYLAGVEDDLIRQLAYSILGELRNESAGGRLLVETAALTLTARLAHAYSVDFVERGHGTADRACNLRIRRAISFIHDNLGTDLSVAQLANVACLSAFHFSRLFKDVTGKTPHAYVSEKRFEVVKRRLVESQAPLAAIAVEAGFSTQAAFARRFRAVTGFTPGEFRRRFS